MKPYEKYLHDELNKVKAEFPALINTARQYKEGRNIVFAVMKRRTKANSEALKNWLKENL